LEYVDFARFSDEELLEIGEIDDEVHSTDSLVAPSLGLAYGITDRLTLGFRLPHVTRRNIRELPHHDDEEPEEHHDDHGAGSGDDEGEHGEDDLEVVNAGSPQGIGDLLAIAQLRLAGSNTGTSGLSLIAGLEMPTGSTDEVTTEGERFETEHQPGSGSWDPILGLAASKGWGRASVHGNVIFQLSGEGAQATTLGDAVSFNLAFVHSLGGVDDHAHAPDTGAHGHDETTWDGIIELNGEHRQRDETAGVVNENSGGDLIYLSPGLRVRFAGKWSAFAQVGIPILDRPNGFQHETDYRAFVGVGVAF
jgi:hypothetical protein